jgi:mTERF
MRLRHHTLRPLAAASAAALPSNSSLLRPRPHMSRPSAPFVAATGWNGTLGPTRADAVSGRRPTHSSIAAVRRQPESPGSGPADERTQQPSSTGTGDKGGSKEVDGSARVEELQQAVELELGVRLAHVPAGLGKVLGRYPGMDLRGRVRGLQEAVGREDAAALLQSHPPLLLYVHPSKVPARLDALAAAFETDRKAVVRLCSRIKGAGAVLQVQPHKAQQRVEALCSVLQLGPQELLELCAKSPLVLAVDPDSVLARAAALGEGLGLDTAGVAELCRRRPSCLMVQSSSVVAVVEAVGEALEVAREEAVQLCLRCPFVVQRAPASIAAKGRALKQQLGLQGGDLANCMVRQPPVGEQGAWVAVITG